MTLRMFSDKQVPVIKLVTLLALVKTSVSMRYEE